MALKSYYIVTLLGAPLNAPISSLEEAKWNVSVSYTREEAIKYLKDKDEKILHFIGDNLHSETPINVDEKGNIKFGKTRKL